MILFDNGATLNIIPLTLTSKIGYNRIDIILYKMMMLDFIGGIREIVSVLQMDLIIVSNTNVSIRINEIIDKYSLSNLA
jgi:hypothetical protein